MNDNNTSWFHCGRCGSLFQSEPGERAGRLCTKCGFDPNPGIREAPAPPPAREAQAPANTGLDPAEHHGKRTTKRRKPSYFMVKLIVGWSLLLAVIIFGARKLWPEENSRQMAAGRNDKTSSLTLDEDGPLLKEGALECSTALSGYLNAGTPEGRNQFVINPVQTASKMARFYSQNPITHIDPLTLTMVEQGIIHLPGESAIEGRWTSQTGLTIDGIFRKKDGQWRLDWEQFARYSDYPWSLFLAGSGPDEGEFRLLARERLAEERKHKDTISLVLYAPRFGNPGEPGFQSPEFLVSRNNQNGQLLDAAFKQLRNNQTVFDSKLSNANPDSMIRVRVKVRRIEADLERKFEIEQVIACHWYSIDDPGVKPEKRPAEDESNSPPDQEQR